MIANTNWLRHIPKVALVIVAMYAIITRMWAAEDAYITFRYIENFINGLGLVYNIGERVEGFTHPLWLLMVTIPALLGASIRASALWLSLILSVMAFVVVAFKDRDDSGNPVLIPIALVLFATHTGFRDFSVSGMEFPLVCLLMALFYLSYKQHGLLEKPIYHGALLSLLYLARPETALIPISFYVIELFRANKLKGRRNREQFRLWIRKIINFTLPILLLAGGYHLFRWIYYGELFSNSYYAKAGLGSYWSQGITYLIHFWRYSPVLLLALLVFGIAIIVSRRFGKRITSGNRRFVMLAQALILMVYVTRLGGDFMAYRFFLPSFVIFAILMNDMLACVKLRATATPIISSVLIVLTVLLTLFPIMPPQRTVWISDERQFYDIYHPAYRALFEEPAEHKWYQLGLGLRKFQEATDYPVAMCIGNIGYLGYAAGPKVRILDVIGLVDYDAARNWGIVRRRGRPGHEYKMTLGMAIAKDVTFWHRDVTAPGWEEVMGTPLGKIMTLDPHFLKFYAEKIGALKNLKQAYMSSPERAGQGLQLMEVLEEKYNVRIEDL